MGLFDMFSNFMASVGSSASRRRFETDIRKLEEAANQSRKYGKKSEKIYQALDSKKLFLSEHEKNHSKENIENLARSYLVIYEAITQTDSLLQSIEYDEDVDAVISCLHDIDDILTKNSELSLSILKEIEERFIENAKTSFEILDRNEEYISLITQSEYVLGKFPEMHHNAVIRGIDKLYIRQRGLCEKCGEPLVYEGEYFQNLPFMYCHNGDDFCLMHSDHGRLDWDFSHLKRLTDYLYTV